MDGQRFDALARSLAARGASRRALLRAGIGGLGGGALTLLGVHAVAAKPKPGGGAPKPPKPGGRNTGCKFNSDCPDDGNPCTAAVCDGSTGQCAQIAIVDGTQCGDNATCEYSGSCVTCDPYRKGGTVCPNATRPGGYACYATNWDVTNCGACGNECRTASGDYAYCCAGVCSEVWLGYSQCSADVG